MIDNIDNRISNSEDVIDSRDVIETIHHLRDWVASETDPICLAGYKAELATLEALAEQCEGYASDWQYGEQLIRRSYWVDYVEQLIKDCGDIPENVPSYIAIDWEETAERIEVDYMSVDFDGVEYLIRSC